MAISIGIKLTSEVIRYHVNINNQKKKPLSEINFLVVFRY